MNYITFFVLGLSAGALYAALAQSLVVGYRGSGVLNLAQGAMAMFVAYTYRELRLTGRIALPPIPNPLSLIEGIASWFGARIDLPDIPTFLKLGPAMGFWPAFAIALVVAALLGLAVHALVFRPLRSAPTLGKIVASVGLLIVIQAIAALRFGTESVNLPRVLPTGGREILGVLIPDSRLILAAVAVGITILISLIYRFTRFGIATEAAAADEVGAIVTGLAPDRLAALNWTLSSVIAGSVGVLFASVTGLSPTSFTLLVLPALGAALLGGLRSFVLAAVAGLVLGGAQSLTLKFSADWSWFPKVGAAEGLPFLAIILAMIIRGRRLPQRGALTVQRLPSSPEPRHVGRWTAVLAPLALVLLVILPYNYRSGLITTLIGIVLALSVVVLSGLAGQISLMQMALAGISALAMTRIAADWGIPFPIAPLLSALIAAAVGVLVSLPALRVRGMHLAITTLGAAVAAHAMLFSNQSILRPEDSTSKVPKPSLFGIDFGVNSDFPIGRGDRPSPAFGVFALVVAVLAVVFVANIRSSATGRQMLAIRSNERAAAGLGIDIRRTKVIAFAIAAFLAGLAGAMNAYRFQGVTPDTYTALASITLLAVVYLGGISSVSGAIVAGFLITGGLSPEITKSLFHMTKFEEMIMGFGLVLTAVLNPEGVSGVLRERIGAARKAIARRRRAAPTTHHESLAGLDSVEFGSVDA